MAKKKYWWGLVNGIEWYVYDIQKYLYKKGKSTAEIGEIVYPLNWWIFSGRASAQDCKVLVEKKPYRIGQILMQGGTVDEAVARILEYIGR